MNLFQPPDVIPAGSERRATGAPVKACPLFVVPMILSAAVGGCGVRRLPGVATDQPASETRNDARAASQLSGDTAHEASQTSQDGGKEPETGADSAVDADGAGAASETTPAPPRERDVLYPPERRVNVAEWLQQHGARGALHEGACWEARLGVPPEPGLVCFRQFADAEHALLYRIHGGALQPVWDHAVATSWTMLNPVPSADGSELVLRDERGCEQAYCEAIAKYDQHAHGRDWVDSVVHTCEARGRHVWNAGRYVRSRTDVPAALTRGRLKPNTLGECTGVPGFVRRSYSTRGR